MKALVIGATGAVGKDLVQQLIEDSSCERIDIFVRREVKIPVAKAVAASMIRLAKSGRKGVEIIESQDILKA